MVVNTPVLSFSFYQEDNNKIEQSFKPKLTFNVLEVIQWMWQSPNLKLNFLLP